MYYKYIIISLSLCLSLNLFGDLKTSVIIPCWYKHVCYLNNLLHCYEQQSVLPDEVIIVVSDVDKADSEILNKIQEEAWKFPVKLIMVLQRLYAGKARNIGCSHAIGDIFIEEHHGYQKRWRNTMLSHLFYKKKSKENILSFLFI